MLIIGSKTSSIKSILEKISPEIALIGVGENNKFGHPSESTLNNLKEINCRVYRTDKNGEIIIRSNGTKFKIDKLIK